MGVTAYAHMRLGIRLEDSDLWTVIGHQRRCANRHEAPSPTDKFCPKCGERFENAEELQPTQGFALWADLEGCDPQSLYEGLLDNEEICPAADIQSSENQREGPQILCVKLRQASDYSDKRGPMALEELEEAKEELRKKAERLGIEDRPMALYCQIYWSC